MSSPSASLGVETVETEESTAVDAAPKFRNKPLHPFTILMNLAVYPLLIGFTIVSSLLSPLAFVVWKVATRWDADRIVRHFIWIYGRTWMTIIRPFISFRAEGFDNFTKISPLIIAVNHLSFFDTYFMGAIPLSDVAFTVRSWPFKMLWYSQFMKLAKYVDVEKLSWDEIHEACRNVFAKGGNVLFFPEGHRSRDGELQRFYSGAFGLSAATGVPILPLCISGTDELLPPGKFWLHPAKVKMRALPPVDPKDFSGSAAHLEMRKHVKSLMEKNLRQMKAQCQCS